MEQQVAGGEANRAIAARCDGSGETGSPAIRAAEA
jgi:hypothetical protein